MRHATTSLLSCMLSILDTDEAIPTSSATAKKSYKAQSSKIYFTRAELDPIENEYHGVIILSNLYVKGLSAILVSLAKSHKKKPTTNSTLIESLALHLRPLLPLPLCTPHNHRLPIINILFLHALHSRTRAHTAIILNARSPAENLAQPTQPAVAPRAHLAPAQTEQAAGRSVPLDAIRLEERERSRRGVAFQLSVLGDG